MNEFFYFETDFMVYLALEDLSLYAVTKRRTYE